MKKSDVIKAILNERLYQAPKYSSAHAFAPTNIALCKYWGKRNQELNLPVTSSLSISLGDKGAAVDLKMNDQPCDVITLNNVPIESTSSFSKKLVEFLNLFRRDEYYFDITIQSNIPIAAGMASSACGFASTVQALNQLFGWELSDAELSILARLGSGSASRSIWQGFVEWHAGERDDGMDSYGESMTYAWPDFCVGLMVLSSQEKSLSSREAMQRTVATSPLYSAWPAKVAQDLATLKHAIAQQHFQLLGETAESNAMNMHATMLSAWPPVTYFLAETIVAMRKIWQLRQEGLSLYFTQDAGPNLKLLFLEKDAETIKMHFPTLDIIKPFGL